MTGSGDGANNSAGDRGPADVPSPGPSRGPAPRPRPGPRNEAGHEGLPGDLDADGSDRDGLVRLASSRGRLLLTTVVLGSAIASLTSTVANIALPAMATDLGIASSGQKWIVNAFGITLAALIPVGGTLGDRFGRVRTYRIGVAWFLAASLLCAVAPNIGFLIVARLLQGVGGALLTPGSLAIIQATLRRDDRGAGVGAWSGISGVASAIGPLIGGVLVEASWRWVFVINVPIGIVVLVLSRWIPETSDHEMAGKPVDVAGAALLTATLGGATYALIDGPEVGASPGVIGAVITALVAGVALWRVEHRAPSPMVPPALFRSRQFDVANLLTFTIYGGMGVMFFLLPIQLQVTAGWSPLAAGSALLPVTLIMLVLSTPAGTLGARIGPRVPLTVGSIVMAVGMVLMTRIGSDATFIGTVAIPVVVFGVGLAAIVAPVTSAALGSVPDTQAGAASGVNNSVARTGSLLAVAGIPGLAGLTGDALNRSSLLNAGYSTAMLIAAGIVGASGVLAWFLLAGTDARRTDTVAVCHACPVDGTLSSPLGDS